MRPSIVQALLVAAACLRTTSGQDDDALTVEEAAGASPQAPQGEPAVKQAKVTNHMVLGKDDLTYDLRPGPPARGV